MFISTRPRPRRTVPPPSHGRVRRVLRAYFQAHPQCVADDLSGFVGADDFPGKERRTQETLAELGALFAITTGVGTVMIRCRASAKSAQAAPSSSRARFRAAGDLGRACKACTSPRCRLSAARHLLRRVAERAILLVAASPLQTIRWGSFRRQSPRSRLHGRGSRARGESGARRQLQRHRSPARRAQGSVLGAHDEELEL